jgi:hypothetical protein
MRLQWLFRHKDAPVDVKDMRIEGTACSNVDMLKGTANSRLLQRGCLRQHQLALLTNVTHTSTPTSVCMPGQ